jgi:hypothetical protein
MISTYDVRIISKESAKNDKNANIEIIQIIY